MMISYDDIKSGRAAVPAETGDHGLALNLIQIDGGTQSRATLNQHVVDDYAEAIKAGATFPPIVVFYDGKKHWLADGFHRFHAYQKAGKSKVAADVRQGTRRDAILHSVGANEAHGLRRTNDDKRRAVLTLLNDAEWSAKPERWIATTTNVSHTFVQKIRAAHLATLPDRPAEVEVERGGTVYTQKVAKAAKTNAPEGPQLNDEPSPEAGPQAEASPVGTDTGTPADREGRHEGEAASADLPTVPVLGRRDPLDPVLWQVTHLREAWAKASDEARAIFLAETNLEFQAKASEDNGATGEATMRPADSMTGEASRVDAGRTASATSERMDATAGETAINSPSAAPPAVTAPVPQAPQAGAVPLSPDPLLMQADDGRPEPSVNVPPAQNDIGLPDVGQDGDEPNTASGEFAQQPASAAQARNEPGSASGASVTFNNPRCQHPDTCNYAHSKTECHDCFLAWAERPKEEQVRLWAEAEGKAA